MPEPTQESQQTETSRRFHNRRDAIGVPQAPTPPSRGLDALVAATRAAVAAAAPGRAGASAVVNRLSEQYAYIRLDDVWRPWRFLRQMEGAPPIQLGTEGFAPHLVDDANPARHYMAFVFLGYWLPAAPGLLMLWLWEVAGFIRYRGLWSWPDVEMGLVGLRHGRAVRRYGAGVLPALMRTDLAARED